MAAPPSTASQASWNPAVPPPPVNGATVGIGLGEGLCGGVPLGDPDGLVEVLPLAGELPVPPPKASLVPDEPLAVGESTVTDEEGLVDPVPDDVPDDVQAESATQASMVARPQPTAVSLTRGAVHAVPVRALIGPPSYSRQ
jgi:hypothetical protein